DKMNKDVKAWVEEYRKFHCEKTDKLEKWLIAKHENAVHNFVRATGTGPTPFNETAEIANICLPGIGKALKMHLIKGKREIELWRDACEKTLASFDRPAGGWAEISVQQEKERKLYVKIMREHHVTNLSGCPIDEEGHVPDWALKQGVSA